MSKLYVCNFADENYALQQKNNTQSAYQPGKADEVYEYHPEDLADLKLKYPDHFSINRGYGLWFWKPYLILKTMEQMSEGDYLFYCDSGSVFIDDIHKLILDLEQSEHDIMFFEQPLLNRCFTKKETFFIMGSHDFSGNQLIAAFLFLKKSHESISYMQSWFNEMLDIRVLSPQKFLSDIKEDKCFIAHREDQSVLTILCKRWKIKPFRDPSDLGLFPWGYLRAGGYHRNNYTNSHYPVILLHVRKNNLEVYKQNYIKAVRLHKLGLNNEFTARLRLLPMYMRHCGRLIADKVGLGKVLDRLLRKNGK